jgi:parallel beta-helix repeat protein
MGKNFLLWLVLSISSYSSLAAAEVLYVATNGSDEDSGTAPTTPLRTINAATNRARPGTIIMVRGGVYKEGFWFGASGSESSYIVLQSYPGESAIIDCSANTNRSCVGIGGNYIEFRGFEIRGSKGPGVLAWNNHHTTIVNNNVHDSVGAGISIDADRTGISHDHLIQGNSVYRNVLNNQQRIRGTIWSQGITTARSQSVKVIGNTVHNNYGEGIGAYLSKQVTFEDNVIYDNFSVELYLDNVRDSTIEKNFIYTTADSNYFKNGKPALSIALAIETYAEQVPNNGNKIINNITVGGRFGFYYGNYDRGGGMQNNLVAHNTFVNATDAGVHIDTDPGHAGNQFVNNIVFRSPVGILARGSVAGFFFGANCWSGGSAGAFSGMGDVDSNPLGSSWVSGCWRTSQRMRRSDSCSVPDHVFP